MSYEELIADYQRRSIKRVMEELDLKVTPWCREAGISESTLRNFLAQDSNSITTVNAQKLAEKAAISISKLLCGSSYGSKSIAGHITNGARIIRESGQPTAGEIQMLMGTELSTSAEVFRVKMQTPSIDDDTIIVFDDEIKESFDAYVGRKVLARLTSGEEYVKLLYKGSIAGRYNLQAYGITGDQSALMENVELASCALLRQIIVA